MTIWPTKLERHSGRPKVAGGFTLTELLIAIAIFVVLMAMAVPVFRTLTGSRSVEQATNLLSAQLARVRNEAIGAQEHRAVMFYIDNNTGKTALVTLRETLQVPAAPRMPADVWFDLDQSAEPTLLPAGVGLQTVAGGAVTGGVRTGNGYIGYYPWAPNALRCGGAIVFTPEGRLFVGVPGMYLGSGVATSALGRFLLNGANNTGAYDGSGWGVAQVGFALFESDPYLSQFGGDAAWQDQYNYPPTVAYYNANEKPKEDWLDQNATPFVVNRLNGTLIRGE